VLTWKGMLCASFVTVLHKKGTAKVLAGHNSGRRRPRNPDGKSQVVVRPSVKIVEPKEVTHV